MILILKNIIKILLFSQILYNALEKIVTQLVNENFRKSIFKVLAEDEILNFFFSNNSIIEFLSSVIIHSEMRYFLVVLIIHNVLSTSHLHIEIHCVYMRRLIRSIKQNIIYGYNVTY